MASLTKNWRTQVKRREPKTFLIPSLGVDVVVRPMSALRMTEIEKKWPNSEDGKRHPKFLAAIIADSIVDESGELVFTVDDLLSEEIEQTVYAELLGVVCDFCCPAPPKNSTPAIVSPTV